LTDAGKLAATLREAIDAVRGGAVVVVDVRVAAGYHGAMSAGVLGAGKTAGK
jgi:hypothetical protein